ncbi:exodeoxyribonuclease III [Phycicoccus sp. M110.8]|uniref:exodeoxyribonuclease III n=1 Tax=Phycicoccus sp. M110.8 TaxID=3075433 RepID=UPI0028FD6F3B|nr:exodeoxyribonuclease III [Phycicoccus sp. M110.8]MDU0312808.1 exodeoxyribonuclease III [Phycicoccus sp. M110.8]
MRVISANVNGVRAAARRGGMQWLAEQEPDVLCLQEVRASDEQLAQALEAGGFGDWHVAHTEAEAKGRAGVAVVSRNPLLRVATSVGTRDFDGAGRWVEADVVTPSGTVTLASTYVHTGEAGTPRQQEKYRFLDAITVRLMEWAAAGALAVVTGDLNIAHREDDLKNWKGNLTKSGFLADERAYLDHWFADGEWVDVHRSLHGPGPGPYTWWSWRGKAFDNDAGWRIDYQVASRALAARATAARAGRAAAYDQRWSDHAAMVVDYDLG